MAKMAERKIDYQKPHAASDLFNRIRYNEFLVLSKEDIVVINHQRPCDGFTPLLIAVSKNSYTKVSMLLINGADPRIQSKSKIGPLDLAKRIKCDPEIVKILKASLLFTKIQYDKFLLLSEEDIDVINYQRPSDGFTPLLIAVSINSYPKVSMLLEHDADPYIKTKSGIGSLDLAKLIRGIDPDIVKILYGYQKPHEAYDLFKKIQYDEFLLLSEEDIGLLNYQEPKNGVTPLLIAVDVNSYHKVSMLLEHGADPRIKAKSGTGPLELAEYAKCDQAIIQILKDSINEFDTRDDFSSSIECSGDSCD